jgi:hypothetical protein
LAFDVDVDVADDDDDARSSLVVDADTAAAGAGAGAGAAASASSASLSFFFFWRFSESVLDTANVHRAAAIQRGTPRGKRKKTQLFNSVLRFDAAGEKRQVGKAPLAQLALVRQRAVLRQRGLGVVLFQRQHDAALASVSLVGSSAFVSACEPLAQELLQRRRFRVRVIGIVVVAMVVRASFVFVLVLLVVLVVDKRMTLADVRLKIDVLSKRATAHFAHVFAQLEMHGLVVPVQVAPRGESLVAFSALKVLARLALVNSSFVLLQVAHLCEPSQTHIALRPVVAIERVLLARLLVFDLDLLLDLAQRRRHWTETSQLFASFSRLCLPLALFVVRPATAYSLFISNASP